MLTIFFNLCSQFFNLVEEIAEPSRFFFSPNQPDQERTTAYRDSPGPDSRSDDPGATIVGDWEEPSGESRLNGHWG